MVQKLEIPHSVWKLPAIRIAQANLDFGYIIDIPHTSLGDIPKIEPLRSYQPLGVVNIRYLPRVDIQHIRDTNAQDLEVFHNEAVSKAREGRMSRAKSAGLAIVAGVSAVQAASQYQIHQNADNCITPRGRVMTIEECDAPRIEEIKTQSHNEAIAFGVGAALFAGAANMAFRAATKCFKSAQIDFTKAALAVSNIKNCDKYLDVAPPEPS